MSMSKKSKRHRFAQGRFNSPWLVFSSTARERSIPFVITSETPFLNSPFYFAKAKKHDNIVYNFKQMKRICISIILFLFIQLSAPVLLEAQTGFVKQIKLTEFKLQSCALVTEPGEELSTAGYHAK